MGKHELRLLRFSLRFYYGPDNWHTMGKERSTREAIGRLVGKELVRINPSNRNQWQALIGEPK